MVGVANTKISNASRAERKPFEAAVVGWGDFFADLYFATNVNMAKTAFM
jgi:hypothetical protein